MKKLIILSTFFLIGIQTIFTQQTVVSEERIPVNWSDRAASAIIDEVMNEVFAYLSRYEFYHIRFELHNNSSTGFWTNEVLFETRQNPFDRRIEMTFNYFAIIFHFSDRQLSFQGTSFSESWIWGLVAQNRFRREFNDGNL